VDGSVLWRRKHMASRSRTLAERWTRRAVAARQRDPDERFIAFARRLRLHIDGNRQGA
jgi:hypothetical protein